MSCRLFQAALFSDFLATFMSLLNWPLVLWGGWSPLPTSLTGRHRLMLDLLFVLMTLVFFLVGIAYITGCDRLK